MIKILVIDDDEMLCKTLCRHFKYLEHSSDYATNLNMGFSKLKSDKYELVFLDVRLPDGSGLAAIPKVIESDSQPEVIIITGEGDADGAELAIKSGAWDYIEKPLSTQDVTLQITRAMQYRQEKAEKTTTVSLRLKDIIGESPLMKECYDLLAQAASSNVNTLVTGETGTGKELFARAIHDNSSRANNNFVILDCAALPSTLVESVLFGHVKGAFTGADKSQMGLIEQADEGTLFLDEIGELPVSVQKSFLRVLQERRFRPIGSKDEKKSDYRLIAATNRDLDEMVKEGVFRKDLLYRIRSLSIEIPPLRKRLEDIKYIVLHHMDRISKFQDIDNKGFSPDFFEALASYEWPGNVRELVNTIEKALVTAGQENTLFATHLPVQMRVTKARTKLKKKESLEIDKTPDPVQKKIAGTYREFKQAAVENAENLYLQNLVSLYKNDITKACSTSKLSRSRLYELLKKHNLSIFD